MNKEIQTLIRAYADRVITPEQFQKLQQALLEDAAVREQFLHDLNLSASLEDLGLTVESLAASWLPKVDQLGLAATPSRDTQKRRKSWTWITSFVAAALVLIAVVYFSPPNFSSPNSDASRSLTTAAKQQQDTADSVAQIATAAGAVWKSDEHLPGDSLVAGVFALESGVVELEFNVGARVALTGPAEFELKSEGHLHLVSGSLVASLPDEALGFLVTTAETEVFDLGTEFGLVARPDGKTDIHVIDGLVEVFQNQGADKPAMSGVKIQEGQARRLDGDRVADIPLASRRSLLGSPSSGDLGLSLLRGSVRLVDVPSASDLDVGQFQEFVIQELGLTDQQATSYVMGQKEVDAQLWEIRKRSPTEREEKGNELNALRWNQLKEVFTEEQRQKYLEILFGTSFSSQQWIDVLPEQRGVVLKHAVEASVVEPGFYRSFERPAIYIPAGTRVDSYLLHFRPSKLAPVHGVIQFDRPIVGILCKADQLDATDPLVGIESVDYPKQLHYRGVESSPLGQSASTSPMFANLNDEVTVSQDRTTISLRATAHVAGGFDQVRVLTLSEED